MAASPGQTASANPKAMNSLYTQELVQRLSTPGLHLEDVFIETCNAVVTASAGKQVPQEFGTLNAKVFLTGGASNVFSPTNNPELKRSATAIRIELVGIPTGEKVLIDDVVLRGTVYADELAEKTRTLRLAFQRLVSIHML